MTLQIRVLLSFLILMGALTGVTFLLQSTTHDKQVRADLEASLRRSAVLTSKTLEIEQASLTVKANYVASRPYLTEVLNQDFSDNKKEEEEGDETEGDEKPKDTAGERHLKVHEKLDAARIELEQLLERSPKVVDPNLRLIKQQPVINPIFFVLDGKGVGQAALGKDLYKWFGQDLSKRPVIQEVLAKSTTRSAIWQWRFTESDDFRHYLVVAAPIGEPNQPPTGVFVLGTVLSDGLATKHQTAISGQPELDKPGEDTSDVADIALFFNNKILGSTLSNAQQKELSTQLFGKAPLLAADQEHSEIKEVTIDGRAYLAQARAFPGRVNEKGNPGLVALLDLQAAEKPFNRAAIDVLMVHLAILLVGLILLFLLIHLYLKAFSQLDADIQQIIAGNKDHEFALVPSNKIQSGLAQGLNIMSAYLQGKPMPDSDDMPGGWGDVMGETRTQEAKPNIQGVDLRNLMGSKTKDDEQG